MLVHRCLTTAALFTATATAQSNDVPLDQRLDVIFGPRAIHAPGALMHPGHMVNVPNVSTPAWGSTQTGMIIMLDLDVPRDNMRVSLVHWLVPGVALTTPDPPPDANNTALLTSPPALVSYIPPNPPVGDIAHTYQLFLFAQPAGDDFVLPKQYQDLQDNRAPFNLTQFLADTNIPQTDLLATNHFRVRNLSGTAETEFPPPRSTTIDLETAPSASAAVGGSAESGAAAASLPARAVWGWSVWVVGWVFLACAL